MPLALAGAAIRRENIPTNALERSVPAKIPPLSRQVDKGAGAPGATLVNLRRCTLLDDTLRICLNAGVEDIADGLELLERAIDTNRGHVGRDFGRDVSTDGSRNEGETSKGDGVGKYGAHVAKPH